MEFTPVKDIKLNENTEGTLILSLPGRPDAEVTAGRAFPITAPAYIGFIDQKTSVVAIIEKSESNYNRSWYEQ